jgi:hypothetical protein
MQNITVSKNFFEELLASDNVWETICRNEIEFPYRVVPRLEGGIDHIKVTKNQIEIHDIGVSRGGKIYDGSFRIRARAAK